MDRNCWICMEEGSAKDPSWRKICACNLYAHEACLLVWAQNTEDAQCPQCQTRLRVVRPPSKLIQAREAVTDLVAKTAWGTVFFYTGTIATTAVYVLLYGLGANAIQYMCSPEQVAAIFGPAGMDAERGLPQDMSVGEFARRALLIPSVPVALVASDYSSQISNVLLLLLPMALTTKPMHMHGYQRSLYVVGLLRELHGLFRKRYIEPKLRSYAEAILDSPKVDGDNRQIQEAQMARMQARNNVREANMAVQEFERLVQEALGRPAPQNVQEQRRENQNRGDQDRPQVGVEVLLERGDNGAVQEEEDAAVPARRLEINQFLQALAMEPVDLEVIREQAVDPAEDPAEGAANVPAEVPAEEQAVAEEQGAVERDDDADLEIALQQLQQIPNWLLGDNSVVSHLIMPQLLPVASYFLGTILRRIPGLSGMGIFNINLLAGCLIVLGRDVVDVLTARARLNQFRGMRVLEYEQPEEPNSWSFLQWVRFW